MLANSRRTKIKEDEAEVEHRWIEITSAYARIVGSFI